jgi:hypothetical protein
MNRPKKKAKRVVYIDGTKPAPCTFCGKTDELRPYGPNDEMICFDCAMKDEATAKRKQQALFKNALVIIK